jgi:hypothetical protein
MDDDFIKTALYNLFAIYDCLESYQGHLNTCKGITFSTLQRNFVINVSFLI